MRREKLYLNDILDAVAAVRSFLTGVEKPAFVENELLQSAVLHKMTLIGEAASRISAEIRQRYPDVPWGSIIGFRNIVVHEYFAVDLSIVWVAATHDVVELEEQVREIVEAEFPDSGGSTGERVE